MQRSTGPQIFIWDAHPQKARRLPSMSGVELVEPVALLKLGEHLFVLGPDGGIRAEQGASYYVYCS